MKVIRRTISTQKGIMIKSVIRWFAQAILKQLAIHELPIRFAITSSFDNNYYCEVDIITENPTEKYIQKQSIFNFCRRRYANEDKFNAVLIIPTGIGAEIGGSCGDGNPVARLIASACDTLITHPNVVNASDINEMPENTLYVEGSILSRLMMGQIGLQRVRSNKIAMLMDKHPDKLFNDEIVNAVSAARATLGIDCDVIEMEDIIASTFAYSKGGTAAGKIENLERLMHIIAKIKPNYDAIGLSTFIKIPDKLHKKYFVDGEHMVNPWGGIEAMLTHSVAGSFDLPAAHAPMMTSREVMDMEVGVVDPVKAAETSSTTYLHCVLKGLHKSPRVVSRGKGLNVEDVDCLIIPDKCIGLPTLAAMEHSIPVIAVRDNKNIMCNNLANLPFKKNKLFIVDNYLEAVGIMHALKAGITPDAVRRPLSNTAIKNI